jgi:DNA topoisomerase IA
MAQQTAVEFLVKSANEIFDYIPLEYWEQLRDIVQQAKQIEKEQIENAYWTGGQDPDSTEERCQQYYNETYGTE